jgi:hypothetical protein
MKWLMQAKALRKIEQELNTNFKTGVDEEDVVENR